MPKKKVKRKPPAKKKKKPVPKKKVARKKQPPKVKKQLGRVKLPKGGKVTGDISGYDVVKGGISISTLQQYQRCRQACAYKLEGWRKIAPKYSATFGNLFHFFLEVTYTAFATGFISLKGHKPVPFKPTEAGKEMLKNKVVDFSNWYMKDKASELSSFQDWEMLAATAEAVYRCYLDVWWKDDTKEYRWLEQEAEFNVPWNGVILKGYRDGLFIYRKSKKRWQMETKTKGRIDAELDDAISFDGQNLYYITATEEEYKEDVEGVLYNVVRRPGIKPKEGEAPFDYAARVQADIAKKPDHYFKRYIITYGKKTKTRYKEQLKAKLDEFQSWQRGELATFRNEAACIGIWNCEFIQLCATGKTLGYTKKG